jgi:hypothetical protein
MARETVYEERVTSRRTETLFIGLTLLLLALLGVRAGTSGFGYLAVVFLLLACFFLFYAVNYRTLVIQITAEALALRFGIFSWTVPWDTVTHGRLDDTPLWRVGGAGIHFTMIRRRYRVFFNFLEHPRVVVELRRPRGLVRDVAFSTRQPAKVMDIVAAMAADRSGRRKGPRQC